MPSSSSGGGSAVEGDREEGVWSGDGPTVVGLGASAGGLEALEQFFQAIPEKTGLAFVVVQHLSPDFRSLMDELLARQTGLPIVRLAGPTPPGP